MLSEWDGWWKNCCKRPCRVEGYGWPHYSHTVCVHTLVKNQKGFCEVSAKKTKSDGPGKIDRAKPADQVDEATSSIPDTAELDAETSDTSDEPVEADAPDTDDTNPWKAASDKTDDSGTDDAPEADKPDQRDASEDGDDTVVAEGDDAVPDELTSEPEPKPEQAPKPQPVVERVIEKRSVFVPAIFGGVVAAGLGFAVGISDLLMPYLPASLQRGAPTAASAEDVATLQTQLSELGARLDAVPAAPDLSGIEAMLQDGLAEQAGNLSATETALTARLDALEAQITEIAQRPLEAAISDEAVAAYEQELAKVQDALAQQRAEVEAMIAEAAQMEAEASESARVAQAQAAATRLFAALDTGAPFASEVTELQELGVTVPDALASSADGLPSLGALQSEFPDLARNALKAARSNDDGSSGLTGFLQRQLGARSVTPRDGSDPDAILSRVEAALTSGDLNQALTELNTLPDEARAPLVDWAARAASRRDALGAADALAQSLASN